MTGDRTPIGGTHMPGDSTSPNVAHMPGDSTFTGGTTNVLGDVRDTLAAADAGSAPATVPGAVRPSPTRVVAETPRLQLRLLAEDDDAFIVELLNDPAFIEDIGDREVRTLDDARAYIAAGPQAMYAEHGFGLYLVTINATGARAGLCGILKRDGLEHPDIGFAFLPAYRGQGIAREAADAIKAHARDVHGIRHLAAVVDPANARSIRLLEQLGFSVERRITLPAQSHELLLMGVEL